MKKLFLFLFLIFSFCSQIIASEKVSDIKIEGLQRIDPGLIFNSIPFEINDEIDKINFSKAISLIYRTGHFKDVVIEKEGATIIISVSEKPLLYELEFIGAEIFQPDALTKALNSLNIASGLVLDESDLKKAEDLIQSQYSSYGKYTASVSHKIIALSNNRVNVTFYIDEGSISRIKEINLIGNKLFKSEDILDEMSLKTTNYFSWWNKDDRYSKQVLAGDLEKIKSFYMDRVFLDFQISSTVVSISKNKKNVYINIEVDEGKKYYIGKIKISGDIPENVEKDLLINNIKINKGSVFNRKLINETTKSLSSLLGNSGYAFANVNAVPNVNIDNRVVDFNFFIDPGKKIYVRRINIIGNTSTKDEVIRRELRQYESSWFSKEKIDLSTQRLNRTQFFDSVNIETPSVRGNADQVDVNILLSETNTGKFNIGAGVSSSEGIVGTLGLSQANFLGTGNRVSTSVSLGGVNKVYSLKFVDPYWTDDGVSRGFSLFYRDVDTTDLKTGNYNTNDYGVGVDFRIPLDEFEHFIFGADIDYNEIKLDASSPQLYYNYCAQINSPGSINCDTTSATLYIGWNENTTDNPFFPTKGYKYNINADISTPGLDLQYFKIYAKAEKYFNLSESVTTKIRTSVGYGDNYGDDPFPFFKNFRAGGKNSIRGYKEGSVGKKNLNSYDGSYVTYGGKKMFTFGAETYFPIPFVKQSSSYRLSAFIDGGAAFEDSVSSDEIRYSAGFGALWLSGFGPLNISIAFPLNEGNNDQTEKFQFGMGSSF